MRTFGKRSKMPLYTMLAALNVRPHGCPSAWTGMYIFNVVHAEPVVTSTVYGERAAEPVGLFVERPELLRTERLRKPVRREHRTDESELSDDAPQLFGCFGGSCNGTSAIPRKRGSRLTYVSESQSLYARQATTA